MFKPGPVGSHTVQQCADSPDHLCLSWSYNGLKLHFCPLSRINELATHPDPVKPVSTVLTKLTKWSYQNWSYKVPKYTWLVTTDPLCKQGRSGQCTPGEFTPAEVGWRSIMPKAPTPSPLCGVPKDCCSALGNYVVVTLQVRQIHPFLE